MISRLLLLITASVFAISMMWGVQSLPRLPESWKQVAIMVMVLALTTYTVLAVYVVIKYPLAWG
jgi:hypothetical protein